MILVFLLQIETLLCVCFKPVFTMKTAAFFFSQTVPMLAVFPVCDKEHLCLFKRSVWQLETKSAAKQLHLATPTTDTSQDQSS